MTKLIVKFVSGKISFINKQEILAYLFFLTVFLVVFDFFLLSVLTAP